MLKKITIVFTIIITIFLIYFVSTGFIKNGNTYIDKYSLSEDGKEITLSINVTSSVGYIRKATIHKQGGGILYVDCYSTFGGINSKVGAKQNFTLPLGNDTIISIYRGRDKYEEILYKDSKGEWQFVR